MIHIRTSRPLWLFSFLFVSITLLGQTSQEVSLLFVGDVMQHGPQIEGAYNPFTQRYEYEEGFKFIKPIIESKDIAIANLEVTHAGKPYKGYPQFSAPDELSLALKQTGFDVLITANNHSCDGGAKGVIRTLDVLDKYRIPHTGTFRNQAERDKNYPLLLEKNGMTIALLNYTYGTNGLVVAPPLIINYIDSAVIAKDLAKAKKQADYIIVTMHWGTEYEPLPSKYQKKWESYCYSLGADMVIGSHPHVIQPMERKMVEGKEKLTAWSCGNFVSNQRSRYKNGGLIVTASLMRDKEGVRLEKANFQLAYVHKKEVGVFKHYYVLPEYTYYSGFLDEEAQKDMAEFFDDSRRLLGQHNLNVFEEKKDATALSQRELKQLNTGYYTVMLSATSANQLDALMVHQLVNQQGSTAWISGQCSTLSQAKLNRMYLGLLGIDEPLKIARITPFGLQILEE